jgi:N-acyl amino acid synthase of PEP-CTERM/exosortase system
MGETLVEFRPRAPVNINSGCGGDEPSAMGANPQDRALTDLQGVQVRIATTDREREQACRLRYQVYCVENDFEPASRHRDGLETDLYDAQSVHGLLIYRDTSALAGTVRLILPRRGKSGLPLPTPMICGPGVLATHVHRIPAHSTAELSRFAISKSERQRHISQISTDPDRAAFGATARQVVSTISLGLMQAAIAMAQTHQISHLYALMEPALLRMLRGLGIHFEKLGPVVDYHGRRQPCFCDLDELLGTAWIERPDIWAVLTDQGVLWPSPSAEVVDLRRIAPKRPAESVLPAAE